MNKTSLIALLFTWFMIVRYAPTPLALAGVLIVALVILLVPMLEEAL